MSQQRPPPPGPATQPPGGPTAPTQWGHPPPGGPPRSVFRKAWFWIVVGSIVALTVAVGAGLVLDSVINDTGPNGSTATDTGSDDTAVDPRSAFRPLQGYAYRELSRRLEQVALQPVRQLEPQPRGAATSVVEHGRLVAVAVALSFREEVDELFKTGFFRGVEEEMGTSLSPISVGDGEGFSGTAPEGYWVTFFNEDDMAVIVIGDKPATVTDIAGQMNQEP